jgi:hypothetical protein
VQRTAIRRTALVLGGTALALVIVTLVAPIGQSTLGVTFCYPLFGPLQRFSSTLSDSLLARVRAHEDAHADQCRRDGAIWYSVRRLVRRQRLLSEAEGYCAEVRFGIAHGGAARLVYASALDELRERPWFRRVSTAALADALASECPAIAARAAREDSEWRAWSEARRRRQPAA